DLIYMSSDTEYIWKPFSNALFHPWLDQNDKNVELSPYEIYFCRDNNWSHIYATPFESGKYLIGYILKQMEAAIREHSHNKYKITADPSKIDKKVISKIRKSGTTLDKLINSAVLEYFTIINRKKITIDSTSLDKIRQDALDTQGKLLVQENAEIYEPEDIKIDMSPAKTYNTDVWSAFRKSLAQVEFEAMIIILQCGDIKQFVDANGIMLEVLIDAINQKALDTINDNVFEFGDSIEIYDEYREKLMEMVDSK
ncbi:MAG: tellurite resistance TerB C-terminal domain-containing protein, partial [Bacteroidota bacterium]